MITVFEISAANSSLPIGILLKAAFTVVFVVSSIALVINVIKKTKFNLYTVVGVIVGALGFFNIPELQTDDKRMQELLTKYKNNEYEIIEGVVEVLREQPESGRAPGDLIKIKDKYFEIDYFLEEKMMYRNTIAHGGHLKDGVLAKIYYSNEGIYRVDISENSNEKSS